MKDLISRSNAIRWVKAESNPYGHPTLDYESGIKVIEHLERMSSVEAEPVRHAHWVIEECKNSIDDSVYKRYKCSECSCPTAMFIRSPYCSNCGAKMDGE